jgi:hypothetical protein
MPFTQKQMEKIRNMEQSPHDCLVCGGLACLSLVVRDMERIRETGRVDLRCGKCGIKLTITA